MAAAGVALQLSPASPCAPAAIWDMPAATVAPSCGAASWGDGSGPFYVSIFAATDDAMGVGYTLLVSSAAVAAPPVWLEFGGSPTLLVTTALHAPLPPGVFAALAVQNAVSPLQTLRVDRWCGGPSMMDCGPPLRVYIRTCVNGDGGGGGGGVGGGSAAGRVCNASDATPSPVTPYDSVVVVGAVDTDNGGSGPGADGATITLPQGACATSTHTFSCTTFIGVFPDCGDGVVCPSPVATVVRVSKDSSASLIPSACFGSGSGMASCSFITTGGGQQLFAYLGPTGGGGGGSMMGRRTVPPPARQHQLQGGGISGGGGRLFPSRTPPAPLLRPAMMSMTMGPMPMPGASVLPFQLQVSACSASVSVMVCYASYPWSQCAAVGGVGGGGGGDTSWWPQIPLPLASGHRDDYGTTQGAPSSMYTLARNGTASAQLGGWLEVGISTTPPYSRTPRSWMVTLALGSSPVLAPPFPLSSAPTVTRGAAPPPPPSNAASSPSHHNSHGGTDDDDGDAPWLAVTWDAVQLTPLDGSGDPTDDPMGALYSVFVVPAPLPAACTTAFPGYNFDAACGMLAYAAATEGTACAPLVQTVKCPTMMEGVGRRAGGGAQFPMPSAMPMPVYHIVNFTANITAGSSYSVYVTAECSFEGGCLMMPGGGALMTAYVPVVVGPSGGVAPSATPRSSPTITATPSAPVVPPTPPDWAPDAFMWLGVACGVLLLVGGPAYYVVAARAQRDRDIAAGRIHPADDSYNDDAGDGGNYYSEGQEDALRSGGGAGVLGSSGGGGEGDRSSLLDSGNSLVRVAARGGEDSSTSSLKRALLTAGSGGEADVAQLPRGGGR